MLSIAKTRPSAMDMLGVEYDLVAAAMHAPLEAVQAVVRKVPCDWFYDQRCRTIWRGIIRCASQATKPSPVAVLEVLLRFDRELDERFKTPGPSVLGMAGGPENIDVPPPAPTSMEMLALLLELRHQEDERRELERLVAERKRIEREGHRDAAKLEQIRAAKKAKVRKGEVPTDEFV